jgi:hypothetical protein
MAYSSLMSSLIISGTIKESVFKELSKSVSLSKASTLSLSTALVRREKPGLISTAISLKYRITIVVGGNVIKGLFNCLTAINKAPKEIQKGLTIDLTGSVSSTLGIIGVITEKVDDFVQKYSFKSEEYFESYIVLVTFTDTVRKDRDKVSIWNKKVKDNWSKYQRGQVFIDLYLSPIIKLGVITYIRYLATLTENYLPILLIKLFNAVISRRLIELGQLKAEEKSLTGKNAIKALILRDVTIIFREHQEMKRINVSDLNVLFKAEIDFLGVELDKIGLFIEIRKGGLLLRFDNEKEEPVFMTLEAIEPAPEPESLLGPA